MRSFAEWLALSLIIVLFVILIGVIGSIVMESIAQETEQAQCTELTQSDTKK